MKFEVIFFSRKDTDRVELIKGWWKAKSEKDLTDAVLTDYGFMVYDNSRPIASIFLYPVIGSEMAMIGFPISNPSADKKLRQEALNSLFKKVEIYAYNSNYNYLVTYAGSPGAVELFNRENYKVADTNVTQFIKGL